MKREIKFKEFFFIMASEENFRQDVPQDITRYKNSNFNDFIEEKGLKESIIPTKAVNILLTEKTINEFMVQLLKEKNQKILLAKQKIYEKIQKKNLDGWVTRKIIACIGASKIKERKLNCFNRGFTGVLQFSLLIRLI